MTSFRWEQSKFKAQSFWSNLTTNLDRFVKECDGFICNTYSAYEPEAISATRRWLEESGSQKLYTIGPDPILEPSKHGLLVTDHVVPEYGTPVRAFMDKILASRGKNSLLYVSRLVHSPCIMLITKLVNLDVLRNHVVAQE